VATTTGPDVHLTAFENRLSSEAFEGAAMPHFTEVERALGYLASGGATGCRLTWESPERADADAEVEACGAKTNR